MMRLAYSVEAAGEFLQVKRHNNSTFAKIFNKYDDI